MSLCFWWHVNLGEHVGGAITTRLLSTQDGFVHCSPSPSLHLLGLPSEIGQQKSCLNQLAPSHVPNLHSCSWWISTPSFCPLRFPHFWWEPLSCGPFSQQLQLTRLSCWLRENSCSFLMVSSRSVPVLNFVTGYSGRCSLIAFKPSSCDSMTHICVAQIWTSV